MAELNGVDLLTKLAGVSCYRPNCDGSLVPGWYKGDRAVTCTACQTPAVRVVDNG